MHLSLIQLEYRLFSMHENTYDPGRIGDAS